MNHAQVIAYLIAAYPRSEFPQPTQRLYIQEFQHVTAEEFMEAARYHVHTSHYPNVPAIGELEHALSMVRRRQAALPDAFQAWGEVVRELSRFRMAGLYLCEEGVTLRDAVLHDGADYWTQISEYERHVAGCSKCKHEREPLRFSHPLIEQTMRAVEITEIDGDNEGVQRAHFVKAYEQLLKRVTHETLPMLGGSHETLPEARQLPH